MYKILLADDESLARNSVQRVIEDLKIFDVDVAENGKEALALIQNGSYDAILLDIMMPNYNGMEVLKMIEDIRPAPIKIVISGYDRFEYAQRALQYGVNEYLVKPVSSEQIEQLMKRLTKMIEQRRVLIESEKTVEEELEKSREIMKERFLERITCSRASKTVLQEQMEYYGISFQWSHFSVALFSVEHEDGRYDEKEHIIYELTLLKGLQGYSDQELAIHAFHTMGDRIGVLFNYKDLKKQIEIENILDELSQMLREYFNVQLIGGMGSTKESIGLLYKSFQEALMAFRWCVVSKSGAVKFYADIYESTSAIQEDFDVDTLVAELTNGDISDTLARLDQIFDQNGRGESQTFMVMNQIISACQVACRSSNVTCDSELLSQAFAILCMDYGKCSGSAKEVLERLLQSTAEKIAEEHHEKSGFYIEKAKKLITMHIKEGTGEISVGLLANEMGLSKNYFGKIFKASTGMSLSNYVNNLRIKQATELLRTTNMKIYEVGRAVGFENQHYFSVAFKQNVGVSPSEFRELV